MKYSAKSIRIAFLTAIGIVLGVAIFLFLGARNLMGSYDMVNHTWEVEYKLLRVYSAIRNAESNVRGYLLTRDSTYLSEMDEFRADLDQLIPNLHILISDNPDQVKNMRQLDQFIQKRMDVFDETTALYRAGITQPELKSRLALGKEVTDQIALKVKEMHNIESDLLRQREDTHDLYFRNLSLYLVLLTLAMLVLLITIFAYLQKQLKTLQVLQTRLQENNSQLQHQKKALELSNEELESFNYIASHDLKEPLRKIRTFGSMLQKQEAGNFSERGKYHMDRLIISAERMQLLLDDLLAYTRLKTPGTLFSKVALEAVVHHVTANLQELIAESGTTITTHNLPEVNGVPFQLQQLVENLVTNAIKYRRPGVPAVVHISGSVATASEIPGTHPDGQPTYHLITFKDNGRGFPQEYAHKVFDLFTRLHNDQELSGTGIGLTICKKIIDNHNGFITVESVVNQGTTFRVYLPENGGQ